MEEQKPKGRKTPLARGLNKMRLLDSAYPRAAKKGQMRKEREANTLSKHSEKSFTDAQ